MSQPASVPYVVGQWVRGAHFYGRRALIREILEGPRQSIWVLGNRRIGKTSLLKELERLTLEADGAWLPLFWDLQGIDTAEDLTISLREAILDSEEVMVSHGIRFPDSEDDSVVTILRRLKRESASNGMKLLVLCDEAEALVALAETDSRLVSLLGSALRSGNVRSVMASTIRLWALAGTLPALLQDFTPPLYISGLQPEDAASLVRQDQIAPVARPDLAKETVDEIGRRCGHHPYLLQLLSKRTVELDDLEKATNRLLWDPMIGHFFTVDFEALSPDEQLILRHVADGPASPLRLSEVALPGDTSLEQCLLRLEQLGFIEASTTAPRIASIFFQHWLREGGEQETTVQPAKSKPPSTQLRVGEWSVEANANLIVRGAESVRLEPRVMNLLVFLATNAGEVISKDQIVDAVWDGAFISESALTRTIADLRKALGDDARNPRYLETISKRGYRLVAVVGHDADESVASVPDSRSRFMIVWNGRAHRIDGREFLLGRDPDCSLCISSNLVSRRHARLVLTSRGATIEDLGSRNGTRVNATLIDSPKELSEGDEIRIGSETLVFRDAESPATTHTDLGRSGMDGS